MKNEKQEMNETEQAARNKAIEKVHRDMFEQIMHNKNQGRVTANWCEDMWNAARDYYQGQWILVSERLPSANDDYLVTMPGAVDIATFVNGGFIDRNGNDYWPGMAIAWMPLPSPFIPKEKP